MAATGSRGGSREQRRVRIEQTALELFREHGNGRTGDGPRASGPVG